MKLVIALSVVLLCCCCATRPSKGDDQLPARTAPVIPSGMLSERGFPDAPLIKEAGREFLKLKGGIRLLFVSDDFSCSSKRYPMWIIFPASNGRHFYRVMGGSVPTVDKFVRLRTVGYHGRGGYIVMQRVNVGFPSREILRVSFEKDGNAPRASGTCVDEALGRWAEPSEITQ